MPRAFLLPLLALGSGLALVAGTVLAQNGGPEPDTGQAGLGSEECTSNTSDALERLQELLAQGEEVEDGIAAIEACGPGEDGQTENGDLENGNGEGENGDGNGDGVGISQVGEGHEACSEATQHALEVLNELLARGEPVAESIAAVEACGTGADEVAQPADNGPPEGVPQGQPEGVPPENVPLGAPEGVPPEDVPQGPPEGVPPEDVPLRPPEGVPPVAPAFGGPGS